MVKWETLATPKGVGGLGFADTRIMNKCLLSKWIFKLQRRDGNICCNLLRKKYPGTKSFFSYIVRNCHETAAGRSRLLSESED